MASAAVKLRTSVLLCLACIVEGADMAVLPALYLFIAKSLRASPSQLGVVTLCRALTQAVSSPIRCAHGPAAACVGTCVHPTMRILVRWGRAWLPLHASHDGRLRAPTHAGFFTRRAMRAAALSVTRTTAPPSSRWAP